MSLLGAPVRYGDSAEGGAGTIDERAVEHVSEEVLKTMSMGEYVRGRQQIVLLFVICRGPNPRRQPFVLTSWLLEGSLLLMLGETSDRFSFGLTKPVNEADPKDVRRAVREAVREMLAARPGWLDVDAGWDRHPLSKELALRPWYQRAQVR